MSSPTKVLVFGYGNPSRLDDGLGPAVASAIEAQNIENVDVDSDYQLNIEDATIFQEYDVVIFADADASCPPPFHFTRIEPVYAAEYTSHSVAPEALYGLGAKLFGGAEVPCYVMGIRGNDFNDFGSWMSDEAQENMMAAVAFLLKTIRSGEYEAAAAEKGLKQRNIVSN